MQTGRGQFAENYAPLDHGRHDAARPMRPNPPSEIQHAAVSQSKSLVHGQVETGKPYSDSQTPEYAITK